MSDRTLRQRVQIRLADGTLPREFQASGVTYGALHDRCVVCDRTPTQVCYRTPHGAFAFHEACYTIWREEAEKGRSA